MRPALCIISLFAESSADVYSQMIRTGKHPIRVKARSLLCYRAVRKLGFSATELSKKLGISQPSVSISVKRGERIAKAEQLKLV